VNRVDAEDQRDAEPGLFGQLLQLQRGRAQDVQERAHALLAHLQDGILPPIRLHQLTYLLLQAHACHEILGPAFHAQLWVLVGEFFGHGGNPGL
jgi:hypothetical protein